MEREKTQDQTVSFVTFLLQLFISADNMQYYFFIEFNILLVKFITLSSPFVLQVVQKFRSIFCKQQTMRTFPDYDTEISRLQNWGMSGPTRALKKRADWIPFIKVTMSNSPFSAVIIKSPNQSSGCIMVYFNN